MAVQTILKDEVKQALREEGGAWLKSKREEAGLSQKGMAKTLNCMFTFISQLEAGRGRVPPDRYLDWALALKLDPREFVCTILFYYEPLTYEIIFKNPRQSGAKAV